MLEYTLSDRGILILKRLAMTYAITMENTIKQNGDNMVRTDLTPGQNTVMIGS